MKLNLDTKTFIYGLISLMARMLHCGCGEDSSILS